ERVVFVRRAALAGRRCELLVARRLRYHDGFAAPPGELGAQVIGHAPGGDLDQPAARVLWHPFPRPLHRGGEERFLHGVLLGGEVAEAPPDRAENLRREIAQQVLAGRVQGVGGHTSTGDLSITSRTSIGMPAGPPPLPGAAEARAAIS